ncbi:unnamed protein product [Closterium sp. NIES-65]|nr:unnamed protein product [Closterium sp. NIES-65]
MCIPCLDVEASEDGAAYTARIGILKRKKFPWLEKLRMPATGLPASHAPAQAGLGLAGPPAGRVSHCAAFHGTSPDATEDGKQQQHSDDIGSTALAFGGLSFDECSIVFLSPNATCCHPAAPADPSSAVSPTPASQAATFSASSTASDFPFPCDASFPIAATSNATVLSLPVKRSREDCPGLGADQAGLGGGGGESGVVRRRNWQAQSVAEQFQQQGASSRVQDEEGALVDALLLEEHQQMHGGGGRRRAQSALWPRMEWESALPDDVLLGVSSLDAGFTAPHAPMPVPLPTAALAGSVPGRMGSSTGGTLVVSSCTQPELDTCSVAHDNVALFFDTPLDPQLLPGHAPTVPQLPRWQPCHVPSAGGPQERVLPGTAGGGVALEEWALEQRNSREGGTQVHRGHGHLQPLPQPLPQPQPLS